MRTFLIWQVHVAHTFLIWQVHVTRTSRRGSLLSPSKNSAASKNSLAALYDAPGSPARDGKPETEDKASTWPPGKEKKSLWRRKSKAMISEALEAAATAGHLKLTFPIW